MRHSNFFLKKKNPHSSLHLDRGKCVNETDQVLELGINYCKLYSIPKNWGKLTLIKKDKEQKKRFFA